MYYHDRTLHCSTTTKKVKKNNKWKLCRQYTKEQLEKIKLPILFISMARKNIAYRKNGHSTMGGDFLLVIQILS